MFRSLTQAWSPCKLIYVLYRKEWKTVAAWKLGRGRKAFTISQGSFVYHMWCVVSGLKHWCGPFVEVFSLGRSCCSSMEVNKCFVFPWSQSSCGLLELNMKEGKQPSEECFDSIHPQVHISAVLFVTISQITRRKHRGKEQFPHMQYAGYSGVSLIQESGLNKSNHGSSSNETQRGKLVLSKI